MSTCAPYADAIASAAFLIRSGRPRMALTLLAKIEHELRIEAFHLETAAYEHARQDLVAELLGEPKPRRPGGVTFADGTVAHLGCYEEAEVARFWAAARWAVDNQDGLGDPAELTTNGEPP